MGSPRKAIFLVQRSDEDANGNGLVSQLLLSDHGILHYAELVEDGRCLELRINALWRRVEIASKDIPSRVPFRSCVRIS